MGTSETNTSSSSPVLSSSASPQAPAPAPAPAMAMTMHVILSPCAACKILRRRCVEKCVLAPYFPPTEPTKFTIAHRVFGASNIIKFLQELPENQRADAVSSMVYEASARIRDPVYGCAGAISQLQKQVNELRAEIAKAQAELLNIQCQQTNLVSLVGREYSESFQPWQNEHEALDDFILNDPNSYLANNPSLFEDGSLWEPLWT